MRDSLIGATVENGMQWNADDDLYRLYTLGNACWLRGLDSGI